MTTLVSEKAHEKGLVLECTVAPEVPTQLVGDPLRLGQILINYANNAVKFTASGSVHIAVAIDAQQEDRCTLRFSVTDTGIGLKPEQIARMFQSFEQADMSTTRQYGGTGLGLAISKNLAQAMGGQAGVQSQFGQGSTFWFTAVVGLNTAALASDAARASTPQDTTTESALQPLAGNRLLLVEDNEINQLVATELLRSVGMEVDVADNGRLAIEQVARSIANQRPYALVLMDMQMPVMDGIAATRAIRAAHGDGLPIVAMTANAMQSDRDRCAEAGMNDFVAKPIHPQALWKVLLRWLQPVPHSEASSILIQNARPMIEPASTLPAVAGLNVQRGLAFANGDAALYRTLLQKFVTQHANTTYALQQALTEPDAALAERTAHTLKGMAATLGAADVAERAASVESLLQSGAQVAAVQAAVQALDQTLRALLESLRSQLPDAPSSPAWQPTRVAHTEAATQAVQRLRTLLLQNDPEAQAHWAAHAGDVATLVQDPATLHRAIEAFDFDAALEALDTPRAQ